MNSKERRNCILEELKNATGAINATHLAEQFHVTRQIIVADIALLRAAGHCIRAEHKGYRMERDDSRLLKTIVCRHAREQVTDEFYAVVDNGGQVLNVIVEHAIYGQLSASLDIASRYDADEFVKKIHTLKASQLSDLTNGIHIHTVAVKREEDFARICRRLSTLNILVDSD